MEGWPMKNYRHGVPIRAPEDFLVFGAPVIDEPEIEELVASMRSGWLGTGPKVARFEADFAAYKQAMHVAAVNSCTAGLHLSMLAAGVGPGDEVITTPLTFCATVNAIIHAGATPVLADVDPATMNIDADAVRGVLTPRTRALVPVHFAGRPCEMDELEAVADARDLKIIEDCAHAIETEYHGRPAGTIGDFGCFSFYVTKNVVTGEGGMVCARSADDIARIKVLALHGMTKDAWRRFSDDGYRHYQVVEAGFKYNMMDLQAAIGIHQLEQVEKRWVRRQQVWHLYEELLADVAVERPAPAAVGTRHGLHLYTVRVPPESPRSRDEVLDDMTWNNIGVGVHYLSVAEHPYYQERYHWRPEDHPNAMAIGRTTISLPLSAALTDDDVQDVVAALRRALGTQ